MAAPPAVPLRFLMEVAEHVLRVGLFRKFEVLEYVGLLPLGHFRPSGVNEIPQ